MAAVLYLSSLLGSSRAPDSGGQANRAHSRLASRFRGTAVARSCCSATRVGRIAKISASRGVDQPGDEYSREPLAGRDQPDYVRPTFRVGEFRER